MNQGGSISPQSILEALGGFCRALRAWQFYPQGHPSRKSSILNAHTTLLRMLDGQNLSLACGRSGFSFPNGAVLKDTMGVATTLSYELFIRRVQKITFLHDLKIEDLLDFLRIISLSPDLVMQAGGMEKLMEDHGIRTIWANEFDLKAIQGKRLAVELRGTVPAGLDEVEQSSMDSSTNRDIPDVADSEEKKTEQALTALIERLGSTSDEDIYPMLARQCIDLAMNLISHHNLLPLLALVELFIAHATDMEQSGRIREAARLDLEKLALEEEFLEYLIEGMDTEKGIGRNGVAAVVAAGGLTAVRYVTEKMGTTANLSARKKLAALLAQSGKDTIEPILLMMEDARWYVVRNLAAILGDIGRKEAVPSLEKCLRHPDIRVSKEAIRSLSKITDKQAETAIISVLKQGDTALWPQAIASLGGMKSREALDALLTIVCSKDSFLKNIALKSDALTAIAMIGDKDATPFLIDILESRHLISPSRWAQLKIAVAGCLGKLGDSRALPALKKKMTGTGDVARACATAVETIERQMAGAHDR